jgi:hypothetical protein
LKRKLRWLILLAVPLLVTFAVQPTPASAAGGCWTYGCLGHDPSSYGCDWGWNSYNVARDSDGVAVANLWNYYSYNCKANWAAGSLTRAGLDRGYRIQIMIQGPGEVVDRPDWCTWSRCVGSCDPASGVANRQTAAAERLISWRGGRGSAEPA